MITLSKLLTVQEVAESLRVTDQTVRRYIKEGRLKAVKLNRRDIRIPEEDAQDFMERLSTTANE